MNQYKFLLPLLLILFIISTSCQMKSEAQEMEIPGLETAKVSQEMAPEMEQTLAQSSGQKEAKGKKNLKLIRTASIRVKVADHKATFKQVQALVTTAGGYIGSERYNGDANFSETTLDIRVPNSSFDSLANQISRLGNHLDYKNITTEDVSEEFVDLQARIKTKKASEETYITILRSSKKVEDVLQVQEHIRRIREEIEVAEGRLRFLSDRVSLSTISLTFYEDRPIEAVAEAGSGFGQRVKIAFLRGWQGIQWGLLALAYLWPLILLTVLFFIVRKKIFLRHKRPQTQA